MTDSLKERYYFKAEHDAAFDEALARIEELEQRGEELGGAVEEQIIKKRALQATIAKLEGENARLKQESNYWQMAAMHANEREEESQAEIERLREALGGTIMEQEKDIVERLRQSGRDLIMIAHREFKEENPMSGEAFDLNGRKLVDASIVSEEAADEIERLRSQLADLESRYAHTLAHPSPIEIGRALLLAKLPDSAHDALK